ncbi:hypothetical protein MAHJHV33_48510 [Mycobacterium avium subsp. hominissuis]
MRQPHARDGAAESPGHRDVIGKVDKAFRLDLHAQVEAEGLIYLADYVAVTRRFSGTIPGVRLPHSVASTRSEVKTSDPV